MLSVVLTAIKYLGLLLAGALGVHGVLHDYKEGGRLTREGRRAVALIAIAASLGMIAAVLEQVDGIQRQRAAALESALSAGLTDLSISWRLDRSSADVFDAALDRAARPLRASVDLTAIAYLKTALRAGQLTVARTGTGWRLQMMLERPQGLVSKTFADTSIYWNLFKGAMQELLGDQFELSIASGLMRVDLASLWPTALDVDRGQVRFTIDRPSVSPAGLRQANLTLLHRGPIRPSELRLRSTDPRIVLDQTIPLSWQRRVWRSYTDIEGRPLETPQFHSSAGPLEVGIR